MSTNPPPPADPVEPQLNSPARPLTAASPGSEAAEVGARAKTGIDTPAEVGAMDEDAKRDFLWHTHDYLGQYARFADTKAAFAGTAAAALLGGLYTAKVHVAIIQNSLVQWTSATWLAAFGGLFLICTILLSIWTVLPRLGTTQSAGFIYWGSIAAHGKVELLQTSFHTQSTRTLNDHLLHHIFDISSNVCIPKYRSAALCIWTLVIGGFLATTALILQDVTHKTTSASAPAPAIVPLAPPKTSGH